MEVRSTAMEVRNNAIRDRVSCKASIANLWLRTVGTQLAT